MGAAAARVMLSQNHEIIRLTADGAGGGGGGRKRFDSNHWPPGLTPDMSPAVAQSVMSKGGS